MSVCPRALTKLRFDALALSSSLVLKEAGLTCVMLFSHMPPPGSSGPSAIDAILVVVYFVFFRLTPLLVALTSRVGWPAPLLCQLSRCAKPFVLGLLYLITALLFMDGIHVTCRASPQLYTSLGWMALVARGSARALLLAPFLMLPRLNWLLSVTIDTFLELGLLGHLMSLHHHLAATQVRAAG